MMNTPFDGITTASKASFEAFQKLTDINTSALNELATIQMSLANIGFESGLEQMKLVSSIKDYEQFMTAETQLATDVQEKFIKAAEEAQGVLNASQDEVVKWFNDEMPKMSEFSIPKFDLFFTEEPPKKTPRKAKTQTKAKPKE